jgi:hypothetical protein
MQYFPILHAFEMQSQNTVASLSQICNRILKTIKGRKLVLALNYTRHNEGVWKSGGMFCAFLTSSPARETIKLHAPASLHCVKTSEYPLPRWLGGPQIWPVCFGKQKIFAPPGVRKC